MNDESLRRSIANARRKLREESGGAITVPAVGTSGGAGTLGDLVAGRWPELDPAVLDCPADSHVGHAVARLLHHADALLAVMTEDAAIALARDAVVTEAEILYFG
jgi:hypothetical protein